MSYYMGDYYRGDPGRKLKLVKKGGVKLGGLVKKGAAMAGKLGALKLPAGHRRHHRMRVTNVRALHRAMRRVQGFAKLARRTIGFTHRVHMKKRRRR